MERARTGPAGDGAGETEPAGETSEVAGQEQGQQYVKPFALYCVALLGKVVQPVAFLFILTRLLGPEDYGRWVQVSLGVGLLMPAAILGLDAALIRFLPAARVRSETGDYFWSAIGITLATTAAVAVVVALLSSWIAHLFFTGLPDSRMLVALVGLMVIGEGVTTLAIEFFRGTFQYRSYITVSLVRDIGWVVVGALIVVTERNLVAVAVGYAGWLGAVSIGSLRKIQRSVGRPRVHGEPLRVMLKFSGPRLIGQPVAWMVKYGVIFVVSRVRGPTAVAAYAISNAFSAPVLFLYGVVLLVMFPTLASLYSRRRLSEVRDQLLLCTYGFVMVGVAVSFACWMGGRLLVPVLTSSNVVHTATDLVPLQLVAAMLLGIYSVLGVSVYLVLKTWVLPAYWVPTGVLLVVLCVLLVPPLGVAGAVIAQACAYAVGAVLMAALARKEFGAAVGVSILARVAAAGILASVPAAFLNGTLGLVTGTVVFVVAYPTLLTLLRVVSVADWVTVRALTRTGWSAIRSRLV